MDATAEQQLTGCDRLLRSRDESTLINPMLQPFHVYSGVFLRISGWFAWLSDVRVKQASDILVVETSFGNQLCYGSLSTLEAGPRTRTGSGLLSVVSTTGSASVAGSLTPPDSFLLREC